MISRQFRGCEPIAIQAKGPTIETVEERFRAARASLFEGCKARSEQPVASHGGRILNAPVEVEAVEDDISILTVQSDAVTQVRQNSKFETEPTSE